MAVIKCAVEGIKEIFGMIFMLIKDMREHEGTRCAVIRYLSGSIAVAVLLVVAVFVFVRLFVFASHLLTAL